MVKNIMSNISDDDHQQAANPALFASMKFKKPTPLDLEEKPYDIRCLHPEDIPPTNVQVAWMHDIPIHDMRPLRPTLSLDTQGFVVADMESRLTYDELFDEEKLRSVFADEVRTYLHDWLGAKCVFFHECVIRKRNRSSSKDSASLQKGYGEPAVRAHGG